MPAEGRRHENDDLFAGSLPTFGTIARFGATMVGLLLMLCGAFYSIGLALTLIGAVSDPAGVGETIDTLAAAIGPDALQVNTEQANLDGSRVLAIFVLGGLVFAAGWLLLSLITVGAKVVASMSAERRSLPQNERRRG